MSNYEDKRRLFDQGRKALARTQSDYHDVYMCSLCLGVFALDALDELTFEHVPPKSLGGRPLVLTCYDCNSLGGGPKGVDTHARRAEDYLDFSLGQMSSHRRARFGLGGETVNVDMRRRGSETEILGLPKDNPPGSVDLLMSNLMKSAKPGTALHFDFMLPNSAFESSLALASWLRSAYLIIFAVFGYHYILREVLEAVRKQIRDPEKELPTGCFGFISEREIPESAAMLAFKPTWMRAVVVTMRRYVVLLPFLDDDSGFYDRIRKCSAAQQQIEYGGLSIRWPRRPEFYFDFLEPKDRVFLYRILARRMGA